MASRHYFRNLRNVRLRTGPERNIREKYDRICEICGREMERDPESGEYRCPDCYDSHYNA
jgi:tRNA(Ile2) C34 agmatinyltransferase TiaS